MAHGPGRLRVHSLAPMFESGIHGPSEFQGRENPTLVYGTERLQCAIMIHRGSQILACVGAIVVVDKATARELEKIGFRIRARLESAQIEPYEVSKPMGFIRVRNRDCMATAGADLVDGIPVARALHSLDLAVLGKAPQDGQREASALSTTVEQNDRNFHSVTDSSHITVQIVVREQAPGRIRTKWSAPVRAACRDRSSLGKTVMSRHDPHSQMPCAAGQGRLESEPALIRREPSLRPSDRYRRCRRDLKSGRRCGHSARCPSDPERRSLRKASLPLPRYRRGSLYALPG